MQKAKHLVKQPLPTTIIHCVMPRMFHANTQKSDFSGNFFTCADGFYTCQDIYQHALHESELTDDPSNESCGNNITQENNFCMQKDNFGQMTQNLEDLWVDINTIHDKDIQGFCTDINVVSNENLQLLNIFFTTFLSTRILEKETVAFSCIKMRLKKFCFVTCNYQSPPLCLIENFL